MKRSAASVDGIMKEYGATAQIPRPLAEALDKKVDVSVINSSLGKIVT